VRGRDLALLEEPVAHVVAGPVPFRRRKEFDRRVDMRQVMVRMRDLRLIGRDLPEDLGALLRQSLNDQRLGHASIALDLTAAVQPAIWCICYLRPQELVPHAAVETFREAVLHWLAGRDVVPFDPVLGAPLQDVDSRRSANRCFYFIPVCF
jgi:hypothetical protein